MKYMSDEDLSSLSQGSVFFGTGGGGDPVRAKILVDSLCERSAIPELITTRELDPSGVCITGFPVGALRSDVIGPDLVRSMALKYQAIIRSTVQAIIPVEIGPLSLATAMELASLLSLPILDADIVGGRSTPEVFLETITLDAIPRTPLIVFNALGKYAVRIANATYKEEERFLRAFASRSGGFAYTIGYPLTRRAIQSSIAHDTVSDAMRIGKMITRGVLMRNLQEIGAKELYSGTIRSVNTMNESGFSVKYIEFQNTNDSAKVYAKNENLILWINDTVRLTCPDLIIILDAHNYPIFNEDLSTGMNVNIIGVKSNKLWRSRKGIRLFSPNTFGFPFKPVLL